MTLQRTMFAASIAAAAIAFSGLAGAQQKELKIGVIFDYTGAFAAGGSEAAGVGTKIAIDMVNERGGVEGYKINAIYADAQSKTEVAINEATRLLDQEKVNLIMGVYSSAHCVPMAQRVDAAKKFMWANVCIASAVFKDKKLSYVFRPQVHGDQFGEASCSFIAESAREKLGTDAKNVKVAVIYEDGPYGAGVAASNEAACKKLGIQVVCRRRGQESDEFIEGSFSHSGKGFGLEIVGLDRGDHGLHVRFPGLGFPVLLTKQRGQFL